MKTMRLLLYLRRNGFQFTRRAPEHFVLRNGDTIVVVPRQSELRPDTVADICRKAGLAVLSFVLSLL
ncbi:MAG: type II toxin-antitoxin system HicA family toxin [Acidobacteriota bacterium]